MSLAKYIGLTVVFLWFVIFGLAHFTAVGQIAQMVPPFVPFPRAVVVLTGTMFLGGAAALWVPQWRPMAGLALFVLTLCVTPANIYMWKNPQMFPAFPASALGVRLLVQLVLLVCIWWSSEMSTLWTRSSAVPAVR